MLAFPQKSYIWGMHLLSCVVFASIVSNIFTVSTSNSFAPRFATSLFLQESLQRVFNQSEHGEKLLLLPPSNPIWFVCIFYTSLIFNKQVKWGGTEIVWDKKKVASSSIMVVKRIIKDRKSQVGLYSVEQTEYWTTKWPYTLESGCCDYSQLIHITIKVQIDPRSAVYNFQAEIVYRFKATWDSVHFNCINLYY